MKLTYKFDNDEKKVDINRLEYLNPTDVEVYAKEGDKVYVTDGDYVYINQLIKESSNGIKTYATISGNITIDNRIIKIINDNTESSYASANAVDDVSDVKKEEIIKYCEELGIDHANKLIVDRLKNSNKVLVVNAMDVEPYQFNSNYLFQDNVKNLLDTINLLSSRFNLNAYLFLSKYDDNNVDEVKKIINNYPDINFKVINEVFPFNTNELLAKKYFKEYKFDDILFFDTFSLYKLFIAVKDKLPVTERYITVCINDAEVLDVIKVKYGSNLGDILKNGAKVEYAGKYVYLNNFMRKVRCKNVESLIISDNIKTIFINDEDAPSPAKCIKCGKCVDVCPLGINPLAKKLDPNCIRCGLCNYVCPANINLLDKM